jgi:Arc/MetJ family transcription regulator
MRTNIELDDRLMAEAMAASGLKTKKATIEAALRTLVRRHRQDMAIAALAGACWDGDLDTMREGRLPDQNR